MASFNELAQQYLKQLKESSDKQEEVKKIITKINDLVYSESKKHLSEEDKKRLVETIRKSLEEAPLVEAADNTEYLNLIDQILNGVKK